MAGTQHEHACGPRSMARTRVERSLSTQKLSGFTSQCTCLCTRILSGLVQSRGDAAAMQDAHPAAPVDALQRRQHAFSILRAVRTVSGLLARARHMQPLRLHINNRSTCTKLSRVILPLKTRSCRVGPSNCSMM